MSSPAPEFEKKFLNMMDAGALYAEKTIFWGANDLFPPILVQNRNVFFIRDSEVTASESLFRQKKDE